MSRTPVKVPITGTVSFPDWDGVNDHIQGIAPKNDTSETRGALSGSSSDSGYIATYVPSIVRGVSIWPNQPQDYDHGGGAQMLGDLMAFAVESDDSNDNAQVGIYDEAAEDGGCGPPTATAPPPASYRPPAPDPP